MPWSVLLLASSIASGPTAGSVNPADQITGDITTYVLGYGVVGIGLLVLAWLYYRGWRLISPAREADMRKAVREEGRADLLKELERVIAEKRDSDERASSASRFMIDQLVPMLTNFTSTTSALVPLLQELVRYREDSAIDRRHR